MKQQPDGKFIQGRGQHPKEPGRYVEECLFQQAALKEDKQHQKKQAGKYAVKYKKHLGADMEQGLQ